MVKVKVQGQNGGTENIALVFGRGLRYLQLWQYDRNTFGMKDDFG